MQRRRREGERLRRQALLRASAMNDRLVVSRRELDAVLRLDADQRVSYFIKRVVDWQTAWGLREDGWALVGDDGGRTGFPLWPALEFASAFAAGEWASFRPEPIALADLMGELLPRLQRDGLLLAVFPTPALQGPFLAPDDLAARLRTEGLRYE